MSDMSTSLTYVLFLAFFAIDAVDHISNITGDEVLIGEPLESMGLFIDCICIHVICKSLLRLGQYLHFASLEHTLGMTLGGVNLSDLGYLKLALTHKSLRFGCLV